MRSATWQHSITVAGEPGSRSNTAMVGESMAAQRAIGEWISSAARLAAQASAATESRRQYWIAPPRSPGPPQVGTQSGR